jgi:serine/threonine-protein kinase
LKELDQQNAPLVGKVLEGAYRLTRLIGQGGMGAVYEAVQLRLNKRVAVKLMSRGLATSGEALARFHREAEITSHLGHPHLVNVVDFGTAETGEPYLVMEYLEGEDLDHRIRRVGRMPVPAAVHITRQVASALAAAHAQDIVHRDLKPANVFLMQVAGEPDFVKVLDFGISKMKAARTKLTRKLTVMGTPNYMAPEQAMGRVDEIDHRADQWSLACIAWEMLSGQGPFVADDSVAVLYQVIHMDPEPLVNRVPNLRPEVESVLRRGLSKRQTDRFPSIREFSRAFEAAALGHCAEVTPPPVVLLVSPIAERPKTGGQTSTLHGPSAIAGLDPLQGAVGIERDAGKQLTTLSRTASELTEQVLLRRFKPVYAIAAASVLGLMMGGWFLLRSGGSSAKPGLGRPSPAAVAPIVTSLPVPEPAVVPAPEQPPLEPASKAKPAKITVTASPSEVTPKRKVPKARSKRRIFQEL